MYNCINIELWKRACHKMRDCIYKRSVRSWTTTKTSFYKKETVRQLYTCSVAYITQLVQSSFISDERYQPTIFFRLLTKIHSLPVRPNPTKIFPLKHRVGCVWKVRLYKVLIAYILIIIPFTRCDWEYTSSLLTRCRFDGGCWTPSLFGWNG
jgi:hypothetical protein